MKKTTRVRKAKHLTAAELGKLPPAERDRILRTQAKKAEQEYRTNVELTEFEAFGPHDLYVESSDS